MGDDPRVLKQIMRLTVQIYALRDVAAILMASEARRAGNPSEAFQEFSEALNKRLDWTLANAEDIDQGTANLAEQIRMQYDWIIQAAQRALGIGVDPNAPKDQ